MSTPLNPTDMTPAQAANLFTSALKKPVNEAEISAAIAAGMPTDAYGNLNIIEVAAWLNREASNDE